MIALHELIHYINEHLSVDRFRDYCPNGLQLEGRGKVKKIISGVTASQALIDEAIAKGADAILVHHGYFWKGESPVISGIKKRRIAALLQHDISLLAWHLPLDAHPVLGNNAQLALRLGLAKTDEFDKGEKPALGCIGEFSEPLSASDLKLHINKSINTDCLHLMGSDRPVRRVGWCTGGAQSYFEAAIEAGVDAFITGEVSEPSYHLAKEYGVNFYAAGHHATERYGVQALGQHLVEKFSLEHFYFDEPNPV